MQHLFVVTYGRSGSTLLLRFLNEIDGYCIRGENGGVIRPLANSARILGSTYQVAADWDDGEHSPWFGFRHADPLDWQRRLAKEFVGGILRPPHGTRVTGFKEIRYTPEDMDEDLFRATMDFLAFAFEDSRIIFNTRAAAEVAQSGWWATDYIPAHVHDIIATADRRFREAHARLADRSFMIDYSEYDGKPEGFLPLLEWLGEDVPFERIQAVSAEQLAHLQEEGPTLPAKLRRWVATMVVALENGVAEHATDRRAVPGPAKQREKRRYRSQMI